MKIGEIFVALGIDGEQFQEGIRSAKKDLAWFTGEVTASLYALDKFIDLTTRGAVALQNMSKAAGVASSDLQRLGISAALQNAGADAEATEKKIASFAQNLYNLQHFGTGDATIFQRLGFIGAGGANFTGKTTEQALLGISDAIKTLNDQAAINIIETAGFGPEDLEFFRNLRSEINKTASALVLTPNQIKSLTNTALAVKTLKMEIGYFAKTSAVELAPVWEKIIHFLYGGVHLVSDFAVGIRMLTNAWDGLSDSTKRWGEALSLIFLVYLKPITALVSSILLLLDDFIAYKSGGKSVLGGIFGRSGEKDKRSWGDQYWDWLNNRSDFDKRSDNKNKSNIDFAGLEKKYNLPSGLLHSMMMKESGGNPDAVSSKGAVGLFQFMPDTARQYGINPRDPAQSADGAARMMADLLRNSKGDLPSALAAYNWGSGNLNKYGIQNAPNETSDYIKTIMTSMSPGSDANSTGKTTVFQNTFNVTGTNPEGTAKTIVDRLQNQFNYSTADQNNGAQY